MSLCPTHRRNPGITGLSRTLPQASHPDCHGFLNTTRPVWTVLKRTAPFHYTVCVCGAAQQDLESRCLVDFTCIAHSWRYRTSLAFNNTMIPLIQFVGCGDNPRSPPCLVLCSENDTRQTYALAETATGRQTSPPLLWAGLSNVAVTPSLSNSALRLLCNLRAMPPCTLAKWTTQGLRNALSSVLLGASPKPFECIFVVPPTSPLTIGDLAISKQQDKLLDLKQEAGAFRCLTGDARTLFML